MLLSHHGDVPSLQLASQSGAASTIGTSPGLKANTNILWMAQLGGQSASDSWGQGLWLHMLGLTPPTFFIHFKNSNKEVLSTCSDALMRQSGAPPIINMKSPRPTSHLLPVALFVNPVIAFKEPSLSITQRINKHAAKVAHKNSED